MIELVDFNEIYGKSAVQVAEPAKKTRRSAAKKKADVSDEAAEVETTEAATTEEPKTEE